jgi:hypothetical protein
MNGASRRSNGPPPRIPSGLLYAATCTPIYVELAFLSAESFRQRYPHAPVILFTDQPEHPLTKFGMFNVVTALATDSAIKSEWSRRQLARIQTLPLSPFERTLHVDCDTRFVGDITPAITVLDRSDIAMVERVFEPRRDGDKRTFNAGFCSYRLTPAVRKLLANWDASAREKFLAEAEGGESSEKVLTDLFGPEVNTCGVRGATLPYAYYCTFSVDPRNRVELPRIVMHPSFKETTLSDLLLVAQRWRTAGRGVEARQIVEYVTSQWVEPPPPRPSQPLFSPKP